jgi:zinc transport system substrate-binding protein
MTRRRLAFFAAILAFVLAVVGGCGTAKDPWQNVAGGPKRVLVSFPPLYCFTKNVADSDVKVLSLLTTVGPHDFQVTPAAPAMLRTADLFLVNGLGLEPFVSKLVANAGRKVEVVPIGEAVPKIQLLAIGEEDLDHDKDHDPHGKEDKGHHHHGDYDPHVWLGLPEAICMVNRIRDELNRIDSVHQAGYTQRAEAYTRELRQLQAYGKKRLAGKKNLGFIATHDSLRYFARSFEPEAKLEIVGNIQVQPGVPVDGSHLKELAGLAKKKSVRVIAIEPQFSQAKTAAEALIREMGSPAGVQIIEIDPLETVPAAVDLDAGTYIRKMKANIDALAEAMQ